MKTFTVVAQSHPTRCEVCHQADQFNPETGCCARCYEVVGSTIHFMASAFCPNGNPSRVSDYLVDKRKAIDRTICTTAVMIERSQSIAFLFSFFAFFATIFSIVFATLLTDAVCAIPFAICYLSLIILVLITGFFQSKVNSLSDFQQTLVCERGKILKNPSYPCLY